MNVKAGCFEELPLMYWSLALVAGETFDSRFSGRQIERSKEGYQYRKVSRGK
jgi:hypothetical protein